MSAANKAKGTRFETDIVDWIRDNAPLLRAERLPRAGAKDEGDVAITFPCGVLVVEAKNHKAWSLSDWLRQAREEMVNYVTKRRMDPTAVFPLVVVKRRGKSIGESYAVMELHLLVELVEHLSGDDD
jgi:hypothetical protein